MTETKQTARNHARRWRRFVKRHPHVARLALQWCRHQAQQGARRISMAACFEWMRGRVGHGVRLDNSWRAVLARDVRRKDPRVGSRIEIRRRRVA